MTDKNASWMDNMCPAVHLSLLCFL